MSQDFRKEFEDDRPFWMLPTVDHDLRRISKAEEPTVRKYTINPRLSIEKKKFIKIIENTTLQAILDNITFINPTDEIEWKGNVLKRDSDENIIARVIHDSIKTVISKEIDDMVDKEEEKKIQTNLAKLGKERRGVILDNAPKES